MVRNTSLQMSTGKFLPWDALILRHGLVHMFRRLFDRFDQAVVLQEAVSDRLNWFCLA
jgi:hypothetical protein